MGEVTVECAQHERESPSPRRRETLRRARERSFADGLPQLERRLSAGGEVLVERDDGRGGCCDRGAADQDERGAVLKDQVLAVACGAPEYWRERGDAARLAESLWRGREQNDRRCKMRQPNRRSSAPTLVRIEREISSPSG